MKPGYLTTEFAVTLITSLLTVAFVAFRVSADDQASLGAAAAAVLTNGVVIWKYIASRTAVKLADGAAPPA